MQDAGFDDFGLPDLDPAEYLPGMMFEVGPVRPIGETTAATDWPVLQPFAEVAGLDDEDTMILARMCQGYHEEWRKGENPVIIAPVDRKGAHR